MSGLLAGWWVYVPVHELLHAAACRAAGGEVTRLEIDRLYFGAALARIFSFVAPASDYAGRLSGFDTRNDDWIYLATDLGPFVLTLFPGVWGLRRAAAARSAPLFGAALPFALAPFLSLTGDSYEIGSILTTRLPPWAGAATRELLRGDDLVRKLRKLTDVPGAPWGGALLAVGIGVLWAFFTYALGDVVARALDPHLPGPPLPKGEEGEQRAGRPTPPAGPSPRPARPGRWRGRRPSRRRSGP